MKQNKNFFDELDQDWGDLIADVYTKSLKDKLNIKFSHENNKLLDDFINNTEYNMIRSFKLIRPTYKVLEINEYNEAFISRTLTVVTIGIIDYDSIEMEINNKKDKVTIQKNKDYILEKNVNGIHLNFVINYNRKNSNGFKFFYLYVINDMVSNGYDMYLEEYSNTFSDWINNSEIKIGDIL